MINMDKQKLTKVKILGKVRNYTGNFFQEQDFTEISPVMLGKSVDPLGPDPGSSIVGIPEIHYQGETLRLVTSMILHKQKAVTDGLDKIYVMSPNVRLERPERKATGKHLFEFSQADFEMAHAKMDDVFELVEQYYAGLTGHLEKKAGDLFAALGLPVFQFEPPFARYSTGELTKTYGEDWETKASLAHSQPFWALSHKREFYDKEDPKAPGTYLNYDIIYPLGFGEGLSGAEREHEYERIIARMERDGLDKKPYSQYLEFAQEGFRPSAGAGIGMERLVRFLTRSGHVGDVCMFKRIPGVPVDL